MCNGWYHLECVNKPKKEIQEELNTSKKIKRRKLTFDETPETSDSTTPQTEATEEVKAISIKTEDLNSEDQKAEDANTDETKEEEPNTTDEKAVVEKDWKCNECTRKENPCFVCKSTVGNRQRCCVGMYLFR